VHPQGIIQDVGISAGDCGHHCKEHNKCWSQVLEEVVIFQLHKEMIQVPDLLAKNGRMRQMAVTVNWVTEGHLMPLW
jgi:hypothetical protein